MRDTLEPSRAHARLIRKLETVAELTQAERDALAALPLELRALSENTDIAREGERPNSCCLLVDGLACRYKVLGKGQRQITALYMAGDMPDVQNLQLEVMDHNLGTLAPTLAAFVPHAAMHALFVREPGLAAVFWRDTLIDASIFREWLVGIGRRTARERVAHLICEIFTRLKSRGLTEDHTFALPLTQAEVGDALGLSSVHVNRVLQDLRREGLVGNRGRKLVLVDWPGLQQACQFDPGYLHHLRPA